MTRDEYMRLLNSLEHHSGKVDEAERYRAGTLEPLILRTAADIAEKGVDDIVLEGVKYLYRIDRRGRVLTKLKSPDIQPPAKLKG